MIDKAAKITINKCVHCFVWTNSTEKVSCLSCTNLPLTPLNSLKGSTRSLCLEMYQSHIECQKRVGNKLVISCLMDSSFTFFFWQFIPLASNFSKPPTRSWVCYVEVVKKYTHLQGGLCTYDFTASFFPWFNSGCLEVHFRVYIFSKDT